MPKFLTQITAKGTEQNPIGPHLKCPSSTHCKSRNKDQVQLLLRWQNQLLNPDTPDNSIFLLQKWKTSKVNERTMEVLRKMEQLKGNMALKKNIH